MSLRRAVGFLHARIRLSPRVIPRTAPSRSIYTWRDVPVGVGGVRVACGAAAIAGAAALAAEFFKKAPVDDPKDHNKDEDLKVMFEDWVKKYNKTYPDEEEKAVRFQIFKDTVKWHELHPYSLQKTTGLPNCFADLRPEEFPCSQCRVGDGAFDDPDGEEYRQTKYTIEDKSVSTNFPIVFDAHHVVV